MKAVKKEMSTQDMQAARLLVNGESSDAVAAQIGLKGRTLRRRAEQPHFVAYMDKLRAEDAAKIEKEAKAAAKKIDFGLPDAIEVLAKIAQMDPKTTKGEGAVQIMAIKVMATLLRWVPMDMSDKPKGESDAPEKPSFYRSAWREPVQ